MHRIGLPDSLRGGLGKLVEWWLEMPLGWACACRVSRLLFASPISRGKLAVYARKFFQCFIEEGYLLDEYSR